MRDFAEVKMEDWKISLKIQMLKFTEMEDNYKK
jgi:hypothetical protein